MKYSFLGSVLAVLFSLSSVNAYTVSGAKVLLLKKGKFAVTGVPSSYNTVTVLLSNVDTTQSLTAKIVSSFITTFYQKLG